MMTADLVQSATNQQVNAGNFFNLPQQDMRLYSSFSVQVEVTTVGNATAWNGIGIALDWRDQAGVGNAIYEDVYWIFPRSPGGAFAQENGRFECQDAVHGPYLNVALFNNGVDNVTTDIRLFGNTRSLGRRYVQNTPNTGGVSIDPLSSLLVSDGVTPLGAGAAINRIARLAPGIAYTRMQSLGGTMNFDYITPDGRTIEGFGLAAGQDLHTSLALPRTAVRCRVTDTSGAANNYQWFLTTTRNNW